MVCGVLDGDGTLYVEETADEILFNQKEIEKKMEGPTIFLEILEENC